MMTTEVIQSLLPGIGAVAPTEGADPALAALFAAMLVAPAVRLDPEAGEAPLGGGGEGEASTAGGDESPETGKAPTVDALLFIPIMGAPVVTPPPVAPPPVVTPPPVAPPPAETRMSVSIPSAPFTAMPATPVVAAMAMPFVAARVPGRPASAAERITIADGAAPLPLPLPVIAQVAATSPDLVAGKTIPIAADAAAEDAVPTPVVTGLTAPAEPVPTTPVMRATPIQTIRVPIAAGHGRPVEVSPVDAVQAVPLPAAGFIKASAPVPMATPVPAAAPAQVEAGPVADVVSVARPRGSAGAAVQAGPAADEVATAPVVAAARTFPAAVPSVAMVAPSVEEAPAPSTTLPLAPAPKGAARPVQPGGRDAIPAVDVRLSDPGAERVEAAITPAPAPSPSPVPAGIVTVSAEPIRVTAAPTAPATVRSTAPEVTRPADPVEAKEWPVGAAPEPAPPIARTLPDEAAVPLDLPPLPDADLPPMPRPEMVATPAVVAADAAPVLADVTDDPAPEALLRPATGTAATPARIDVPLREAPADAPMAAEPARLDPKAPQEPVAAPRRRPAETMPASAAVERPDAARPAEIAPSPAPMTAAAPSPAPVAEAVRVVSEIAPVPVSAAPESANAAIDRRLDLAHETRWLDQLARDIAVTAARDGQLRFQLNPEHLGTLAVEVRQGVEGASIRMTADSEQARAIIADAQPRLVAEARAQGLRIADAQVDLGGRGADAQHRPQPPVPELQRRAQGAEKSPAVTVNEPIAAMRDRYA